MKSKCFILITALVILSVCVAYAQEDAFLYQGKVGFGASAKEVKDAFSGTELKQNGATISGRLQISAYDCEVSFAAPSDYLMMIHIVYSGKSFEEAYENFKKGLVQKYGEYSEDQQTKIVDMLKDPSLVGILTKSKFEGEECISWMLDNVEVALYKLDKKVHVWYNPPNVIELISSNGL